MPQRGMEVPAEAEQGAAGEGHRDPAKPVTQLTGFINRPSALTSQTRRKRYRSSCAPSEWVRQGKAAVGAYLRVSGPAGPLTGVYSIPFQPHLSTQHEYLVTASILKATQFRASGPGRRRFSGWVGRRCCGCARARVFPDSYIECCN